MNRFTNFHVLPNGNDGENRQQLAVIDRSGNQSLVYGEVVNFQSGFAPDADLDQKFPIPGLDQFETDDYLHAPELHKIATELQAEFPDDLAIIRRFRIRYCWKKKGGSSNGNVILGQCQKISGIAKHLALELAEADSSSVFDYLIWVARDHASFMDLTKRQMRALVFHELLHVESDEGKPALRGHDFEGFQREVRIFGFWRPSIERMAQAFAEAQKKYQTEFDFGDH